MSNTQIKLDMTFEFVQKMNADRETKIQYFIVYINNVVNSPTTQEIEDYINRIR